MSSNQDTLNEYIRRVTENINVIYARLGKLESKLDDLSREVISIKVSIDADEAAMGALSESVILKTEFANFVKGLTESLSGIMTPAPVQQMEEEEMK